MIKVRFTGDPAKRVKVFNDCVTEFTLTGTIVTIRSPLYGALADIKSWLDSLDNPKVQHGTFLTAMRFVVKGRAIKSKDDTFNNIVGERIAEARAKVTLYNFMTTLMEKSIQYYMDAVMGTTPKNTKKVDWVEKLSIATSFNDNLSGGLIENYDYYRKLAEKEKAHLQELLSKA